MKSPGIFTISLDLELYWGTRDKRSLASYGANILGAHRAVPAVLDLFHEYGVHATWAVVGILCFEDRDDLLAHLPAVLPDYQDERLNPFPDIDRIGTSAESHADYFLAPELIKVLSESPHQELGSHTFSHFYCLERGRMPGAFEADLDAMRALAEQKLGRPVESLVFPRNQYDSSVLTACQRAGIRSYRGNPSSWIYQPRQTDDETLVVRALRLADAYLNLTGHHGHRLEDLSATRPVNVPASRFLRPYSRSLRRLDSLRFTRIARDMTHCARRGLLYHLWWHPENFGTNLLENLAFLRKVLAHFSTLSGRYGMESLNMSEVARRVRSLEPPAEEVPELTAAAL